jgi:NAD(P)-dependent dehydrogenase (short-subunit alcohol dehydrogenase family)
MDINTQGTFLVIRAASSAMAVQDTVATDETIPARGASRGTIVNIGSIFSYISLPKSLQYTTFKSRGAWID